MIESNEFLQIYLVPHLDVWFDLHIRLFDNRMYLDYSCNRRTFDEVRQWKLGR